MFFIFYSFVVPQMYYNFECGKAMQVYNAIELLVHTAFLLKYKFTENIYIFFFCCWTEGELNQVWDFYISHGL